MKSRLLDVGNCDPDHSTIRRMLTSHFDVDIDRVMFVDEAIKKMTVNQYDLVLVNRLIFADGSEGIELHSRVRDNPAVRPAPIMMISNFKEAQERSVFAGGVPGFGKNSVFDPSTRELLSQYLALARRSKSI